MFCQRSTSTILSLCMMAGVSPLLAQGRLVVGEARLVAVSNTVVAAEAPGIVREILVKPGATVGNDAALARLNEELFAAEFDVAAAEFEIAKVEAQNRVNVEYADKSAEVAAAVLEKSIQANRIFSKSIPETEIEKLRLEFEQSRLSGEQAELEFTMAQWTQELKARQTQAAKVRLDGRIIQAPFAGKIAQVYVQPGQWINAGEPIVRLMDATRLRAEAFLQEDFIREIELGQTAHFEYVLAGESHRIEAKVTFIGVEIVEGIFQVWAEFENPEAIHLPGVEGRLVFGTAQALDQT